MTFLLVQIELEFLIVHRLGDRNCNTSCRLRDQAQMAGKLYILIKNPLSSSLIISATSTQGPKVQDRDIDISVGWAWRAKHGRNTKHTARGKTIF